MLSIILAIKDRLHNNYNLQKNISLLKTNILALFLSSKNKKKTWSTFWNESTRNNEVTQCLMLLHLFVLFCFVKSFSRKFTDLIIKLNQVPSFFSYFKCWSHTNQLGGRGGWLFGWGTGSVLVERMFRISVLPAMETNKKKWMKKLNIFKKDQKNKRNDLENKTNSAYTNFHDIKNTLKK